MEITIYTKENEYTDDEAIKTLERYEALVEKIVIETVQENKEILHNNTDTPVTKDTTFFILGLGDIDIITILFEVEDKLGLLLDSEAEYEKMATVGDMIEMLKKG